MDFNEIENHKFIKLVKFALVNKEFTIRQACDASGFTEREFSLAKYSLFTLRGEHERLILIYDC